MQETKLTYVPKIDKYITPQGDLYTDDDLDYIFWLERNWKNTLPHFSFQELMNIFPEAVKPARRGIKLKIKFYKKEIALLNNDQEEFYNNVICKAHFKEQNYLKELSEASRDKLVKKFSKKIRTYQFQLSYLDELEGKPRKDIVGGGVNEADIARAKEMPIENFYLDKLNKRGKIAIGLCEFHKEKTPSLTIYLKQNSFFCYSCQQGGSVIDYVMAQQNIDFLSAVKFILKK